MNVLLVRRGAIGIFAGLVSSVTLVVTTGSAGWLFVGSLFGAIQQQVLPPASRQYLENVLAAAALGIPLWILVNVIALPVASGQMPQWTLDGVRPLFGALVGWMLYGAAYRLLSQVLSDKALS